MKVTLESLEGRVMAQRKVLGRLVAMLGADGREAMLDFLREQSVVQDHQEDPGVVPGEGMSIEGAVAHEMSLILDAAERGMRESPR